MLYPSVVHRTRSTQHLEDTRVHREKHHPSISQARHAFTSQGPRVLSPSVKICCLRLQDPSTTSSPSTTMDDQEASPPPESVRSRSTSAVDTTSPIEKRVLRIVPRTKTVQSRRVKRTVQSVEVTVDTIRNLSSYSEVAAAASLVSLHTPICIDFPARLCLRFLLADDLLLLAGYLCDRT